MTTNRRKIDIMFSFHIVSNLTINTNRVLLKGIHSLTLMQKHQPVSHLEVVNKETNHKYNRKLSRYNEVYTEILFQFPEYRDKGKIVGKDLLKKMKS
jgi:hypothetical protein